MLDRKTYIETVPPLYRGLLIRVWAGKASPRATIKAKCQECVNYEEVVARVGGCTVESCPLWAVRPYQTAGESDEDGAGIGQEAPPSA